ncbi:MAG: hypothetical protein ABSH36_16235 [Solirubrobacteraceae bacterium]
MRTSIVLTAGLVVIAALVGVTLARSPPTLAGTNRVPAESLIGVVEHDVGVCQGEETLPAGTSAIRLSLVSIVGPRVAVRVLSGGQVVTHGSTDAGWTSSEVTVPVAPAPRGTAPVTVCLRLSDLNGEVEFKGARTSAPVAVSERGEHLHGRLRVEYVRAGHRSWTTLISTIARHVSLGRAWSGMWVVFFLPALALSVVALTSWGILRELR